jgi:hypothetical protein
MPITVVLGEQAALDLDTISSEPFPGFVAADHTGARRRIYTDGTFAEICFSENVVKTGTNPVVHHGVAFAPQAILLGSAPVASPTQNPYSATPLTTSNVVSSTPVNNFISTVKFSLAASSGTGFDFSLCPNLAGGIGDNTLGVRIEGS